MIKEYRVWEHNSFHGRYIVAQTPRHAIRKYIKGKTNIPIITDEFTTLISEDIDFPLRVLLWKRGNSPSSVKMTKQAIKFREYRGDDKYTKYGRKYYKKDLK